MFSKIIAVTCIAVLSAALIEPATVLAAAEETTSIGEAELLNQRRQRVIATRAAQRWAQRNPERYNKLVPPGANLEPGGVPFEIMTRSGESKTVTLDSLRHTVIGLGYAELKLRDPENLLGVYTDLYNTLPQAYRSGLVAPTVLAGASLQQLANSLRTMGLRVVNNFEPIRQLITDTINLPTGLAQNPIGICSNEIGWETLGTDDENSDRCPTADYASLGLMANIDFIMKDDLTCVKDQRRRGTCVAHAIAATVETMIQIQGGVPENLSEQDIYFYGEINTDWGGRYNEGLFPDEVYQAMDDSDFPIQYEAAWNYNQSPNRDSQTGILFPNSCGVGYTGELCTDFNFQATEDLSSFPFTYTHPARDPMGWEVLDWYSIPDMGWAGLPDFQIDTAILFLENEYPVHFDFDVADAVRTPDANGYVRFNALDPFPEGAHSVVAVGFVANSDLPPGAPQDVDGRGYFIVKNSWGTDYADCGFVYMSTRYLRFWAYSYRYLGKTVTFR
jgi:hypothetical protein